MPTDPPAPASIEAIRQALGATQEELARHCGVNPRTVRRWLAGESEPRGRLQIEALAQLAAEADRHRGAEGGAPMTETIHRDEHVTLGVAVAGIEYLTIARGGKRSSYPLARVRLRPAEGAWEVITNGVVRCKVTAEAADAIQARKSATPNPQPQEPRP